MPLVENLHSVADCLSQVVAEPGAQEALTGLGILLVRNLSHDEYTMKQLVHLVSRVVTQPETIEVLVRSLSRVLEDPSTRKIVANLVAQILVEKNTIDKATEAGIQISHNVLNDHGIQEHTSEFFAGALSSEEVHQSGATAVWQTLKYAAVPRFLLRDQSNPTAPKDQPADFVDLKIETSAPSDVPPKEEPVDPQADAP